MILYLIEPISIAVSTTMVALSPKFFLYRVLAVSIGMPIPEVEFDSGFVYTNYKKAHKIYNQLKIPGNIDVQLWRGY